jgi:hypothetical protein
MRVKLEWRLDVWKGDPGAPQPLRTPRTSHSLHDVEQRDHLLRQIEALGRILTRLRELIVGGATSAAKSDLETHMREAGLELAMATSLDPNTLVMLLGGQKLDVRRAFVVGALLHMDGLRARADGDHARATRSFRAAESLLVAARPQLDGERAPLADQILEEIRDVSRVST